MFIKILTLLICLTQPVEPSCERIADELQIDKVLFSWEIHGYNHQTTKELLDTILTVHESS